MIDDTAFGAGFLLGGLIGALVIGFWIAAAVAKFLWGFPPAAG